MSKFEVVSDVKCRVGESPVWDADRQALLWCECRSGTVFELDMRTGQMSSFSLPEPIGSFGLADDSTLILAMASGVYTCDRGGKSLALLTEPEPGHADAYPGDRLNDSKVGPDGAFWVGSMHKNKPTASLYRVTADGVAQVKVTDIGTSNGLAFSQDARLMFHSDSSTGSIDRYDFNVSTGEISNKRRIAVLSVEEGRPDGGATDLADRYWSAGVTAGCLNCFSSDGNLEARIDLPVKKPTMVCFGGDDMKTLFITSIRRPDDAGEMCGNVISLRVDVPGVSVARFDRTGR